MKKLFLLILISISFTSISQNIRGVKLGMSKTQVNNIEKSKGTLLVFNDGKIETYDHVIFFEWKGSVKYKFENDTLIGIQLLLDSKSVAANDLQDKIINHFGYIVNRFEDNEGNKYMTFKSGITMCLSNDYKFYFTILK